MLAPGGEIATASPFAAAALESLREYPDFVRELEEEAACSIDFRMSGAVEAAFDDVELAALHTKSLGQAALGIRSESCSHNGLPARFYPDDAVVDPRDVTQALLSACRRLGVSVNEHEPVLEIVSDGKGVRTSKGVHGSDGVLIAAGAWSSALLPGLPRTMPVRGHLISWALTPGLLGPILRHGHTYLLQRRSGVLIAGASTENVGFDRTLDESAADDIQSRAARLLPSLGCQRPSERWNGFRPGIEADGPAIGKIPGASIWTAFGHYRNGILLAPETARRIAGMLT
jgi:glycine oxidase